MPGILVRLPFAAGQEHLNISRLSPGRIPRCTTRHREDITLFIHGPYRALFFVLMFPFSY